MDRTQPHLSIGNRSRRSPRRGRLRPAVAATALAALAPAAPSFGQQIITEEPQLLEVASGYALSAVLGTDERTAQSFEVVPTAGIEHDSNVFRLRDAVIDQFEAGELPESVPIDSVDDRFVQSGVGLRYALVSDAGRMTLVSFAARRFSHVANDVRDFERYSGSFLQDIGTDRPASPPAAEEVTPLDYARESVAWAGRSRAVARFSSVPERFVGRLFDTVLRRRVPVDVRQTTYTVEYQQRLHGRPAYRLRLDGHFGQDRVHYPEAFTDRDAATTRAGATLNYLRLRAPGYLEAAFSYERSGRRQLEEAADEFSWNRDLFAVSTRFNWYRRGGASSRILRTPSSLAAQLAYVRTELRAEQPLATSLERTNTAWRLEGSFTHPFSNDLVARLRAGRVIYSADLEPIADEETPDASDVARWFIGVEVALGFRWKIGS